MGSIIIQACCRLYKTSMENFRIMRCSMRVNSRTRWVGLPSPPNMLSISEYTSVGSMANIAEPMRGSMEKIVKLVGLEKAPMHSEYFTISVDTNTASIDRCSDVERMVFNEVANLS